MMKKDKFGRRTTWGASLALALFVLPWWACDRGASGDEGEERRESAAQTTEGGPGGVAPRTPDCVVDTSEPQLTGVLLTGAAGGCTVFLPEGWEFEGLKVAIAADSAANALAVERLLENGETLYASEGEVELSVVDGRLTGAIRGVDSNEPGVGPLHVRVDVEVP